MLRVTLFNNRYGQYVAETDNIDINTLVLTIKRSADNEGVMFEVALDLKFIHKAKTYLENCFHNDGGVDALVLVTVNQLNSNTRIWEVYQEGRVEWRKYSRDNDVLEVSIEKVSQQTRILDSIGVDVDLETLITQNGTALEPVDSKIVSLHSKKLLSTFRGRNAAYAIGFNVITAGEYGKIELLNVVLDEIETRHVYPLDLASSAIEPFEMYVVAEDGDYRFTANFRTSSDYLFSDFINTLIDLKIVAGVTTITCTKTNTGAPGVDAVTTYTCDQTVALIKGELIKVYWRSIGATTSFAWLSDLNADEPDALQISALIETAPSTCKGLLLFEAVERCLQYHTNGRVFLRSTLLGRTDIGYDEDGAASLILWTNGNQIRKLTSKKIFASINEILNFINAAFCASFGFEYEEGTWYMRLEQRSYFYDSTAHSVLLESQFNFDTVLNRSKLYKQIIYGYSSKLELRQINALDDFNTLRKINTPLANTRETFDISTSVRANGSQIEYQRRLINKTEDSNLDDANFVIVVKRDGDDYKSKKNEGYDEITGVYDFASGYNYDISPARMFVNWMEYLASNVIYSADKIFKWTSGTGNYQATTTKTGEGVLAENGNVNFERVVPLFDQFTYTMVDVPFNSSEIALVKASPFKVLKFRDKKGVVHNGFIDENGLDHSQQNGNASISLLKAYKA